MIRQLTHEEIERRYSLADRRQAVEVFSAARKYLASQAYTIANINAMELLSDGIANALDHRATGHEFRTVRHSRLARQDPQNHPGVPDEFRRCQNCGFICPEPFSLCPHAASKEPTA